jgi:hypothetical protein
MDENRPEDIDTETEDHVYDEACHMAMARPLTLMPPKKRKSSYEKRIEALIEGNHDPHSYEEFATVQSEMTLKHLGATDIEWDLDDWEDGDVSGDLVSTMGNA